MWPYGKANSGSRRAITILSSVCTLWLAGSVLANPAHAEPLPQWHLDLMRAKQMWQTSTGEGVTVAVIDTGVDASRPQLRGQVLEGKDFSGLPGSAQDDSDPDGHGSSMAELIAGAGTGANGEGGYGLAPGAKILPLRINGFQKTSVVEGDRIAASQIGKAIRFATDNDAKVINVSFGLLLGSDDLSDAVRYAMSKDVLIFASAGNDGKLDEPVEHPAATLGVVAVAAVGKDLKATEESQHGPEVDLAAPGEDIVSSCGLTTGYCTSSGTSDATALASASAALIWSEHPDWTANQVLRVMINTAGGPTDGVERNYYIGYGIVRPRIALTNPGDPGPADVSPLPEVVAAQKAEAAAKAPKDPQEPTDRPAPAQSAPEAVAQQGEDGGGGESPLLWAAIGAGALAASGAAAFAVLRARRGRRETPAGFGPPPGPWQ